jgi:hypothetical protein
MRFLVVASFHRLNFSTARLTEAGMALEGGIEFYFSDGPLGSGPSDLATGTTPLA